MKKIIILLAALIAASTLAALISARKNADGNVGDVYDDSAMDFLGV